MSYCRGTKLINNHGIGPYEVLKTTRQMIAKLYPSGHTEVIVEVTHLQTPDHDVVMISECNWKRWERRGEILAKKLDIT